MLGYAQCICFPHINNKSNEKPLIFIGFFQYPYSRKTIKKQLRNIFSCYHKMTLFIKSYENQWKTIKNMLFLSAKYRFIKHFKCHLWDIWNLRKPRKALKTNIKPLFFYYLLMISYLKKTYKCGISSQKTIKFIVNNKVF